MKQMGVMLEEQVKVAEQNTAHEDSSKEIQQLKN
jgi:predicted  nucleic acid-binding Zn-ribbon protein